MRHDEDKKTRLGKMGEICVGNYLTRIGHKVIYSIDPYDSSKDLIVDDQRVEVKTQIPYINQRSFTIRKNQLEKCRSVDALFFVALPSNKNSVRFSYPNQGSIFLVNPKMFEYTEELTSDNNLKLLIRMDQPSVVFVEKISDEDIRLMMKYTS